MAKRSLSRREFLKISALSSSSLFVSGCSTVDNFFMGDYRRLTDYVVILGGGAAGLAAAHALKQRKIPYKVFEASSRIGGRVQTVQLEPEGGAVAELGAEFFELSHRNVFALAKELSLATREVKSEEDLEAHVFSFKDKIYRVKDLQPLLKTLAEPLRRVRQDLFHNQDAILTYNNVLQFERSRYYDSLSLQDLLDMWSHEVNPVILELIKVQAVQRFGIAASRQSALLFLSTLDAEGSSLLAGRPKYRLEGGLSRLTHALYQRAAGVIPDYVVRTNSPLVGIAEQNGIFKLTFRTPEGKEMITTRNVICTIPFSALRNVDGIHDLAFSSPKKQMIREMVYGSHVKGVLNFDSRFWRKKGRKTPANVGNFTGDFLTQKFWDSSRSQTTEKSLLSFQRGGVLDEKSKAVDFSGQSLKDLGIFYPELEKSSLLDQQVVNWGTRQWVGGSVATYLPGQFTAFHGAGGEPEYGGRFHFAGEHISLKFPGTLEGALETGLTAASSINL